MLHLSPGTYPAFIKGYLSLINVDTVEEAIKKYPEIIKEFFENISAEKINHRYAEGKWNIKEMLQHITDAERIFAYRALCIARHDKTPLPGFDEKTYADFANADERSWKDLLTEFNAVRKSTDFLLQSFTQSELQQSGTTNNEPNTAEAISFLVYGHILHHIMIIKERYL